MNKYGGVSWRGVSRRKARKVTKRLARKQERQCSKGKCYEYSKA